MEDINFIPSPNFRKGRKSVVTNIVLHTMSGTYTGSVAWFKNHKSQVSAHYLVSKKGEVLQMVKDEDTAWHVGNANSFCIGIEMEDMSWVKDPKTGKLIRKDASNDQHWYTVSQLDTVSSLVAHLMKKHHITDLSKVIGHNDPLMRKYANNHSDPGNYFPWDKFRKMVQEKLAKE